VKGIEIAIDLMHGYILSLSNCDSQTQNAYYLSEWMKPLANRISSTATLTSCVSTHGDFLLNTGKVLDWNLLNKNWDEAGQDYADLLNICLGDVPIPSKNLMI